jgi:hypothetical protein
MTKCFGCPTLLEFKPAALCAPLICVECRTDHETLRKAREAMNRHLAEHKLEYKKVNPYWPFLNRLEAAAYAEVS